jgi:molecular chaperone DnaK
MDIRVLQGERELADDNMTLDTFQLTGISPQPRGQARAEVTFDIDASGVVRVSATDLQTEQSSQVRLSSTSRPAPEVVQAALEQSRRLVQADHRRREEVESAIRAGNMVAAAREAADQARELPDFGEASASSAEPLNRAGNAESSALADAVEVAAAQTQQALASGDSGLIRAAAAKLETPLKKLIKAVAARRD